MPYVMIRHKVADYARWKRAVRAAAQWRKASGEKCLYACRNSKKLKNVMVWCEWDTTARMRKFMKSAKLRKAMKGAGVIGRPEVSFFDKMDDVSAS